MKVDKNNILVYFIIAVFSLIFCFISMVVFSKIQMKLDLKDGSVGIFGSIIGGIIGGLIAYLVAKRQIDHMNEQEEYKTLLSLRPYLRVKEYEQVKLDSYNVVFFNGYNYGNPDDYETGCFNFDIENIGLGTAIKIEIQPVTENIDRSTKFEEITLMISEKQSIELLIRIPKENQTADHLCFKVGFNDILGNYYEQIFRLLKMGVTSRGYRLKYLISGIPILKNIYKIEEIKS